MLYTVAEVNKITNLSKVSIYKKLKLKEFEGHVSKSDGVTYIDDEGLTLIKDSLKLNESVKKDLNDDDVEENAELEISTDKDDLIVNKELINALIEQLKAKDIQIQELNDRLKQEQELHQNTQVLLKNHQMPGIDVFLLEDHIKEFEDRLSEIKVNMEQRKETPKGIFKKLFKK